MSFKLTKPTAVTTTKTTTAAGMTTTTTNKSVPTSRSSLDSHNSPIQYSHLSSSPKLSSSSSTSTTTTNTTSTTTTMNPHHRRSLRERLRDGIQSTTAGIPLPSFQTKSHSVDSKIIPSAPPPTTTSKLSTTGTGTTTTESMSGGANDMTTMPTMPTTTTTVKGDQYIIVSDKDTLTSLAAKYNSTPNELIRLNRLNSRFIFSGQKLKIPELSPENIELLSSSSSSSSSCRRQSNAQSQFQRSKSNSVFDDTYLGDHTNSLDDSSSNNNITSEIEIRQKKFIKLKVKHITDGNGVVNGTLLITPNAIMFDPNVSDPLVLDQGAEIYGIILPIELIVTAGIFNDISNMKVKQSFIEPMTSTNVILYKPEYINTNTTNTNITMGMTSVPSSSSSTTSHFKQQQQQQQHSYYKPATTTTTQLTSHSMTSSQLFTSLSPLPLGKDEKMNILKRFSFPLMTTFNSLTSSDTFGGSSSSGGGGSGSTGGGGGGGGGGNSSTATTTTTTTTTTTSRPHSTHVVRTCHSLDADGLPEEEGQNKTDDDNNGHDDDLDTIQQLLNEIDIEQWYLCLTTGYLITTTTNNTMSGGGGGGGGGRGRTTTITPISYGQKKFLKPEYWFSISLDDVNELYCFWNIWWPHLYGLVDVNIINSRGYALIDWDTDLSSVLNINNDGGGGGGASTSNSSIVDNKRMSTSGTTNYYSSSDDFESKVVAQAQQINDLTKESWEMIKAPYGKLYSFLQRGQTILTSTTSCDSNYGSTSSATSGSGLIGITSGGSGGGSGGLNILNNEHEFEIVSMSELDNKSNEFTTSDFFIPELIGGPSLIFKTDKHIQNICRHLTARAEGYPWWLVFSTEINGFSLGTLYRKMEIVDEWSPILLVIQDTCNRIFGALISTPLKISEHFYGTGQSFLFNFNDENIQQQQQQQQNNEQQQQYDDDDEENDENILEHSTTTTTSSTTTTTTINNKEPQVNIWKWTGENLFFIKGNVESISIGAGDGKFGLWLDSDLYVGRSDTCWTYGNPPLVNEKDFIVKTLEAWAFGATTYISSTTSTSTAPITINTSHLMKISSSDS